jgi:hypothetical protein
MALEDFIRKIEDLIRRISRLEALESSKIVYLKPSAVRILDDTTPRPAAYTNAAVQVTGVTDILGNGGTLPAKISAVLLAYAVLPTAVGHNTIVVKNPSDAGSPTRIGGYTGVAGGLSAGETFVTLNGSGQYQFTVNQAMNRTVWDVVAYVV